MCTFYSATNTGIPTLNSEILIFKFNYSIIAFTYLFIVSLRSAITIVCIYIFIVSLWLVQLSTYSIIVFSYLFMASLRLTRFL